MVGQALTFIIVFLMILLSFIFLVRFVAQRFSGRIDSHVYGRVEQVIIGGIIAGVIAMFQPWIFAGYRYGFLLVLISTLAFIVWSHITPAAVLYGEEEIANVSTEQALHSPSSKS